MPSRRRRWPAADPAEADQGARQRRRRFGGLKVISEDGWFAARPSGTEEVYKIYGESFKSDAHLKDIQDDARKIVAGIFQSRV